MIRQVRRVPAVWYPEDGPFEAWLASWAAEGLVPEFPWPHGPGRQEPVVVNGRQCWPVALVEKAWLDEHPEYVAALEAESGVS